MIKTKDKEEFLKSEYDGWAYWQRFGFKEFTDIMDCDVAKCECGIYYWMHFKKPCGCD